MEKLCCSAFSLSLSHSLSPLCNFHTGFSCHVMKTVKSVETVEAAEIVNCFIWHRRQLLRVGAEGRGREEGQHLQWFKGNRKVRN